MPSTMITPVLWSTGQSLERLFIENSFPLAELTVPSAFTDGGIDYAAVEDDVIRRGAKLINQDCPSLRYREPLLAFHNIEMHMMSAVFSCALTDSVTHQASKQGVLHSPDYVVAGTSCLLLTQDGKNLIMGVRGQGEDAGKVNAVPSGYVFPPEMQQSRERIVNGHIAGVVRREAEEELGLLAHEIERLKCIGVYKLQQEEQEGDPWYSFTYLGQATCSTEQLLRRHEVSREAYLEAKERNASSETKGELEARSELRELAKTDPTIAPDVWENDALTAALAFDEKDPRVLLDSLSSFMETDGLRASCYGVFSLLFRSQYGREAHDQFLELPGVAENIEQGI